MSKIILAGGTGFVGRYLAAYFTKTGYEVLIISRQKGCIHWQDNTAVVDAINGAELLINLAGKSVDCRYTKKNKAEILHSRTETTRLLGEAVLKCSHPPELWINASTATIYRHAEDRPMTEADGEMGTGFSVDVATRWEEAFFAFQLPATRQVALRMAIVLGKGGGVMKPFINLVKFGLGGRQGNGRQMFSWVHIEDLKNMILFIQANKQLQGVYNCASPNPVTNSRLMQTLRQVMNVKLALPSPTFLLRLGAVVIGTETELILKSRWVVPERLLAAGFVFTYPTLDKAFREIVKHKGRAAA